MSTDYVTPQFAFPNAAPGRWRIPPDFELWPECYAEGATPKASLPSTPPIPPTVNTGDVITSQHENTTTTALQNLWTNEQWIATQLNAASIGAVPTTRQVLAGAGMAGGGALTADVTLSALVTSVMGRQGAVVLLGSDVSGAGGVLTTRLINAGAGMTGGGALSADVTLIANVVTVFGRTGAVVLQGSDISGAGGVLNTRQVIAGAGMTGGGALTGDVTLNAKVTSVAGRTGDVVLTTADTGGVPNTRQVIAGTGLSGGGALTANVTLIAVPMGASGAAHSAGMVPDPGATAGTSKYLREDGSWQLAPVVSVFGRTGAVVGAQHDYTAAMVDNAVDATQFYANPPWITQLNWSVVASSAPAFIVDPTTAKGDIVVRGASAPPTRLPVSTTDGWVLIADSTQALGLRWGAQTGASGGYTTAQNQGTALTQRAIFNFVGAGVTASDDSTNTRTLVTIPGGAPQTPWTSNINAAGYQLYNAGSIGIGTAPIYPLHITGTSSMQVAVQNNAAGGSSDYVFIDDAGTRRADIGLGGTTNALPGLVFYVSPVGTQLAYPTHVRMYINPSGNVGIGSTNPDQLLTLDGTAPIAEIRSGGYLQLRPTSNSWDMRLQAVGNQLNILDGGALSTPLASFVHGGNVGIGTASPQALLNVKLGTNADSTGQPAGTWAGIIYNATNTTGYNGLFVKNNWQASSSTVLEIGSDLVGGAYKSYLSVSGNGFVGHGTASPGSQLTVIPFSNPGGFNVSQYQVAIGEASNNSGYRMYLGFTPPSGTWVSVIQSWAGGAGAPLILQPQGGNVGIGGNVSPSSYFGISSTMTLAPINIATWDNGSGLAYGIGIQPSMLTFGASISPTSGTPQMVLNTTGYLGIGTTAPACPVDTNGMIRSTGNVNSATSGNSIQMYFGTSNSVGILRSYTGSAYLGTWLEGTPLCMNVQSGGVVTIGTSTPATSPVASQLTVVPCASTGTQYARVHCVTTPNNGFPGFVLQTDTRQWEFGTGSSGSSYPGWFYLFDRTAGAGRQTVNTSGYLYIGNLASASYWLQLSADSAAKPSTSSWTVPSDEKLKRDMTPVEDDSLAIIEALEWIRFQYNGLAGMPKDEKCIGLSAQKLRAVLPEAVGSTRMALFPHENGAPDREVIPRIKVDGYESTDEEADILDISYHHVLVHAARAIAQLSARVRQLEGRN
jgi:hypothetical protein